MLSAAALVWPVNASAFQVSNAKWAHATCSQQSDKLVSLLPAEFVDENDNGDE